MIQYVDQSICHTPHMVDTLTKMVSTYPWLKMLTCRPFHTPIRLTLWPKCSLHIHDSKCRPVDLSTLWPKYFQHIHSTCITFIKIAGLYGNCNLRRTIFLGGWILKFCCSAHVSVKGIDSWCMKVRCLEKGYTVWKPKAAIHCTANSVSSWNAGGVLKPRVASAQPRVVSISPTGRKSHLFKWRHTAKVTLVPSWCGHIVDKRPLAS